MVGASGILNLLDSLDSLGRLPEQDVVRRIVVALALLLTPAAVAAQDIEQAIAFHLEGDLDRALAAYAEVVAAAGEIDPNVVAAAYTNSCAIHMGRGEYEPALETCEAALVLRRSTGDLPRTARTLNNLGLTLQNLGRFDEARERFLEALEINRAGEDLEAVAQNLLNLSGVEIQAGDYGDALARIAEALELAAAHPDAPWHDTQRRIALLNEGVALEKLGAFRAALGSYQEALSTGGTTDEGLDALLTVNLGVIYRNLGDPVRAVELFERAIDVYRRIGDVSGLSNALLNVALAHHLNLGRPEAAERAYREALVLAETAGDRPEEIQDLFYLASLLLEQERLDEARRLFGRALARAEASGSAEGRWSALYGLGRVAAAHGDDVVAGEHFDRALTVIEGVRSELEPATHRGDFFGDRRPVFEAAVRSAARAGDAERAFTLVQRAKARELLDALDAASVAWTPPALEAISEMLGENGLLVEFFVAQDELLRWTLDGDGGVELRALGATGESRSRVTRVHRALAGSREPSPEDLERLSTVLLADLPDLDGRRLYVAADGGLRYLPFELLSATGGQGLVADTVTVTYLPSASTLVSLHSDAEPAALRAVALADPSLVTAGPRSRPAALLAARFGLQPLGAARREVDSLERWLGGPTRTLIGEQATEAAFREAAAGGSRVVHLAAHTVIDERPGRAAAVLLTPAGDDDGLLQPAEIAGHALNTDLTVLAGCRTALPDDAAGSSLATLTGAFLAAGARGVLATLWDVEDEATAAFMDQFYWQLGRGRQPAEALRLAKAAFRERPEWSAPHLWAGYVLIGDPPPIVGRSRAWLWIGLAILAATIVVLVGRRRRLAVY